MSDYIRKEVVGNHVVEQFIWNNRLIVYIDNHLTEKSFNQTVKDLKNEERRRMMMDCECKNWARDNILLLTKHHSSCPKYNVEEEARAYIEALLNGIVARANDEDGVHYACFDAFRSAAYFIGKPELVKDGWRDDKKK